jgi:hypothetical protein
MDAWQVYFDSFQQRAGRVAEQQFGRAGAYAEAAHDAYRTTADLLTREHGWSDDRTLNVMRGLNHAAGLWIAQDNGSWEDLRTRLQSTWTDLTTSEAAPPLPPAGEHLDRP